MSGGDLATSTGGGGGGPRGATSTGRRVVPGPGRGRPTGTTAATFRTTSTSYTTSSKVACWPPAAAAPGPHGGGGAEPPPRSAPACHQRWPATTAAAAPGPHCGGGGEGQHVIKGGLLQQRRLQAHTVGGGGQQIWSDSMLQYQHVCTITIENTAVDEIIISTSTQDCRQKNHCTTNQCWS